MNPSTEVALQLAWIFLVFFIALIALTGLYLAWFFLRRAKFNERIILKEKGIDIKDNATWLRTGIVITGIAIGYFVILIIEKHNYAELGLGIGIIILFAGLSTILAHFIGRSKAQK